MAKQVNNGGGDSSLPTAEQHRAARLEARNRKRRTARKGGAVAPAPGSSRSRHVGQGLSSVRGRRREIEERMENQAWFRNRHAGLATLWISGRPDNERPHGKLAVEAVLLYLELYYKVRDTAPIGQLEPLKHGELVTELVHERLHTKFHAEYERGFRQVNFGIGLARKALVEVYDEACRQAAEYHDACEEADLRAGIVRQPEQPPSDDLDEFFLGDRATFGFAPAANPFAELRGLFPPSHAA